MGFWLEFWHGYRWISWRQDAWSSRPNSHNGSGILRRANRANAWLYTMAFPIGRAEWISPRRASTIWPRHWQNQKKSSRTSELDKSIRMVFPVSQSKSEVDRYAWSQSASDNAGNKIFKAPRWEQRSWQLQKINLWLPGRKRRSDWRKGSVLLEKRLNNAVTLIYQNPIGGICRGGKVATRRYLFGIYFLATKMPYRLNHWKGGARGRTNCLTTAPMHISLFVLSIGYVLFSHCQQARYVHQYGWAWSTPCHTYIYIDNYKDRPLILLTTITCHLSAIQWTT